MLTVEAKLGQWRGLYGELCEAEQRLRQARAAQSPADRTAQLELEVRTLQQRCNFALDAVGAALAARHGPSANARPGACAHPA